MVEERYARYLINAIDNRGNKKVRSMDVLVMNEFLKVFPKILLGLQLDKEIEFVIDLLPKVELKDLKDTICGSS